jgi:hypothetical protein
MATVTTERGEAFRSILGLFEDHDDAVVAADKLKEEGLDDFDVLTGTPYPEGAFGEKESHHRVYLFPLAGAIIGLSVALLLTAGTQLAYPLVTGGKPILALPAMFIISYEGTMLGAILFTIIGVLFESRLPQPFLRQVQPNRRRFVHHPLDFRRPGMGFPRCLTVSRLRHRHRQRDQHQLLEISHDPAPKTFARSLPVIRIANSTG